MNLRTAVRTIFAALCMMMLILDTGTSVTGAVAGIDICLKTLIPSLFPFFMMSILLINTLLGQPVRFFRPLSKFCRLPYGSESLLAIGFLGGYPVGAQNVSIALERGDLSSEDAKRMVVFCNNAGPAFIFGFLGQVFQNPVFPWLLWVTHILSALLVGFLIPGGNTVSSADFKHSTITLSGALSKGISSMAQVCGWVILFRILLQFLQRWLFPFLSTTGQIVVTGLLELANGCLLLQTLPSDGLKFVLCELMLGFGGMCVYLQTKSIAGSLSFAFYLPWKVLQGCIGFLVAYWLQFALLRESRCVIAPSLISAILFLSVLFVIVLRNTEKSVAFFKKYDIIEKSREKRRSLCCSERKSKNPAFTAPMAPN